MAKIFFILMAFIFASNVQADEVTTTSVTKTVSEPTPAGDAVSSTTVTTTKQVVSDEDKKIEIELKDKFLRNTALTGTEVTAISENGIVKLTGTVTTQSQADEAIKIAKETPGVTHVESEITIKTKTDPGTDPVPTPTPIPPAPAAPAPK